MNQSIFDIQADFCKAIANGARLQILDALREQPMRVADIARATELSASLVSRHLAILRNIGVVHTHRHGTEIIYQVTDENIPKLCDLVRKVIAESTQRQSLAFDSDKS